MKSFTKEEILNLLENPTSLKNAIIESKGFVLYQSAFYKIDIPKKLLIDTINQYSIRFMVQNFKDTDYSKKEIEERAIKLKSDEIMTIGYIARKGVQVSPLGKKYLEEISKYKDKALR